VTAALLVVLLGALAVGGGLLLYALVCAERADRADREVTDRERAERIARRDTEEDR